MDINKQLVATCHLIAKNGKTPTLALLRAKKSVSASTPQLINALKQWKNSATFNEQSESSVTPQKATCRIQALERRVEKLEQKVLALTKDFITMGSLS